MDESYMKIHPDDWRQLLGDIEQLRKERDEARREVCVSLNGNMKQAQEYAAYRGWDCFKETP